MKKPNFTQEQKDWICYKIGEWYMQSKNNLVNYEDRTHNLGFKKELLKSMICDEVPDILHMMDITDDEESE